MQLTHGDGPHASVWKRQNRPHAWEDDFPSPEMQYIYNETVGEMFNDPNLGLEEQGLLAVIYDYPSGTLREWGKELGIRHPVTTRRMYKAEAKACVYYHITEDIPYKEIAIMENTTVDAVKDV